MRSLSAVRPLYLIVATSLSPALGIGLNGTLPWPQIKSDMSFFARVTKRPPGPGGKNTVIMGRKTYESIPQKFRPLQGRKNLVISRSEVSELQERLRGEVDALKRNDIDCVSSLKAAVEYVQAVQGSVASEENTFIIGGSEIYRTSLDEDYAGAFTHLRILQTEIERLHGGAFKIDTTFPINPQDDRAWRKATNEELVLWVGEDVPQVRSGDGEWKIDGDFKIRVLGWEKELA